MKKRLILDAAISVRMSTGLLEMVRKIAEEEGKSINEEIRKLMIEGMIAREMAGNGRLQKVAK